MLYSKPFIVSFDYNKNQKMLKKIIYYINKNKIGTVSINGLVDIKTLSKIKADFISVDIDYFALNYNNFRKIKPFNRKVKQIRIIVDSPIIDFNILENIARAINKQFKKSLIFVFKFWDNNLDLNRLNTLIKISKKYNFIPNFLFLNIKNSNQLKTICQSFLPYKHDIENNKIFIDSPLILYSLTKKKYYCPSQRLMFHINDQGYMMDCQFGGRIYGNILSHSIEELWKAKLKQQNTHRSGHFECAANSSNIAPYELLASIYNKITKQKSVLYNEYKEYIRDHFNRDIQILDAACGTGTLIKKLSSFTKNIDGLENSHKMAEIARQKTGKKIYTHSFVNFNLNKKYDLILSTFDSVNYILNKEDLARVFKSFLSHLRNNGSIIFDINTLNKFKNHYNDIIKLKINNYIVFFRSSYKRPFWRLKIEFIKNEKYFIETHFERFYSQNQIKEVLKDVGFRQIKILNNLTNNTKDNGRVFVIAKKLTNNDNFF